MFLCSWMGSVRMFSVLEGPSDAALPPELCRLCPVPFAHLAKGMGDQVAPTCARQTARRGFVFSGAAASLESPGRWLGGHCPCRGSAEYPGREEGRLCWVGCHQPQEAAGDISCHVAGAATPVLSMLTLLQA